MPPGRKLPSSKEQGYFASELIGVSGNRKAGGQAKGERTMGRIQKELLSFKIVQTYVNPSSR